MAGCGAVFRCLCGAGFDDYQEYQSHKNGCSGQAPQPEPGEE